mmetsp:Transcript_38120/g.58149  ORF Transcript_38120/g.58149 Transcript_38120/m.58149 type:complete len:108 (-) Transcript_38120:1861-2184(-)
MHSFGGTFQKRQELLEKQLSDPSMAPEQYIDNDAPHFGKKDSMFTLMTGLNLSHNKAEDDFSHHKNDYFSSRAPREKDLEDVGALAVVSGREADKEVTLGDWELVNR